MLPRVTKRITLTRRMFSSQQKPEDLLRNKDLEKSILAQYQKMKDDAETEMMRLNREVSKNMEISFETNEPTQKVRVRFTTRTPDLTVEGVRTALYNYVFAR